MKCADGTAFFEGYAVRSLEDCRSERRAGIEYVCVRGHRCDIAEIDPFLATAALLPPAALSLRLWGRCACSRRAGWTTQCTGCRGLGLRV